MGDDCGKSPGGYPSDCEILEGYRARARIRGERQTDPGRTLALAKAADIRLLLLDSEGVLTDGRPPGPADQGISPGCHARDEFGLQLLHEAGIDTGLLYDHRSESMAAWAEKAGIGHLLRTDDGKGQALKELLRDTGLKPFQVAYMGDDWPDLVLLRQVGLALAPADAVAEVKERVHYICDREGGHGAVREACMLLLEGQKKLDGLITRYTNR